MVGNKTLPNIQNQNLEHSIIEVKDRSFWYLE